ncbi:hypothetical protein BU24DRAFT_494086 [Aaosphaeria arxii CBS 175.79]|uniref:Uncharacterized protein n=1 Tax=Aaosphaeria arxii CBS 175.79 TaxID=1450172 RepID=A0A6A5XKJ2_9PLEO|nr:uncharacterized protein BU24DRAFT_494086 [Aaosphaeria arxii CBS 175.79]KAF2013652.1 hypothetical protein BU24DRAFT_494086 [Aaosphaeria arxii CBS 175.79]
MRVNQSDPFKNILHGAMPWVTTPTKQSQPKQSQPKQAGKPDEGSDVSPALPPKEIARIDSSTPITTPSKGAVGAGEVSSVPTQAEETTATKAQPMDVVTTNPVFRYLPYPTQSSPSRAVIVSNWATLPPYAHVLRSVDTGCVYSIERFEYQQPTNNMTMYGTRIVYTNDEGAAGLVERFGLAPLTEWMSLYGNPNLQYTNYKLSPLLQLLDTDAEYKKHSRILHLEIPARSPPMITYKRSSVVSTDGEDFDYDSLLRFLTKAEVEYIKELRLAEKCKGKGVLSIEKMEWRAYKSNMKLRLEFRSIEASADVWNLIKQDHAWKDVKVEFMPDPCGIPRNDRSDMRIPDPSAIGAAWRVAP